VPALAGIPTLTHTHSHTHTLSHTHTHTQTRTLSTFIVWIIPAALNVMELMFAEWEDGERFSFEDSDRFEEDSLCSFISEAESLCQNWRGWRKQPAGPNSPTVKIKGEPVYLSLEMSLVDF